MNELQITEQEQEQELVRKSYCSKRPQSFEEKKELFNALESADVLLNDCVNQVIKIKDVFSEKYQKIDEKTGEEVTKYRTILFDEDGKTYVTTAYGIINVLERIFKIFGTPENWEEPIAVKVIKKSIKNNKTSLSLELV